MDWAVRLTSHRKQTLILDSNRTKNKKERQMRLYQMADAVRYGLMNTEELRETFLLEGLFQPGEIEFADVDLDRTVIGSAVPVGEELQLETEPELRAEYFLERRELGVFNGGGAGAAGAAGKAFDWWRQTVLAARTGASTQTVARQRPS